MTTTEQPTTTDTTEQPTTTTAITTTAITGTGTAETVTPADQLVSADPDRVQHLDPASLLLDRNVRDAAAVEPWMVSSVRDHGILQPIVAVLTDHGGVRVRFGERRTRAALAAGLGTVPVIVCGADVEGDDAEAARIAAQFAENQNRRGLSVPEQLGAFADLAALGKTAGQIARLTKARRRDVVDGLAAASNDTVRDTVAAAELTLAQGALLAEFSDDPKGYEVLLEAADGRRGVSMDHVASRLRGARVAAAQKAALLDELTTAGVTVIAAPMHSDPVKPLAELTDDPATEEGSEVGEEPAPLDPAAHAACPGHVAFLRYDYGPRVDPAPLVAVYACADPLGHGHRARRRYTRLTAAGAPPRGENETAEQAAAREAAQKDTERAKRRRVRAGNDAWRAAETVRREHVRAVLARKTPPKGGGVYLATTITLDPFVLTKAAEHGHRLAAELLTGLEDHTGRERIAALCEQAGDTHAQVIALGMILAGVEASTGVHSWRHRDSVGTGGGGEWRGENPALIRYLRFRATTGYPLSPIERFAIGDPVDENDIFTPTGGLDSGDDDPDDVDIPDVDIPDPADDPAA